MVPDSSTWCSIGSFPASTPHYLPTCLANFSLSLEPYLTRMLPSRALAVIPTVCHHRSNSIHWPLSLSTHFSWTAHLLMGLCPVLLDAPGYGCLSESLVNFLEYTRQRADCQGWESQFHSGGEEEWTTLKQNCCCQIQSKTQALRKAAIKNTKSEFSSYKRPG